MRDFNVTAEPSGSVNEDLPGALPFVIQKHAASHLHYDFRLGWRGVLKSWAVAKGPSFFPGDKRLAVQVEDHPLEYGGFEGIIPEGQYGGGTVMLWDQGTWQPQQNFTDIDEGLRKGSLKFLMQGSKLKGKWALIRMGGKAANEGKPNWLLIKEHDEYEYAKGDPCITEEQPNSASTGRSLEEIAASADHTWNSNRSSSTSGPSRRNKAFSQQTTVPSQEGSTFAVPTKVRSALALLPKEKVPNFIAPQLAVVTSAPPNDHGWLHELKLDGYRIQARKDGTQVQLLTRSGLDWTHRMGDIAEEIANSAAESVIFDGEVVVLADNGTTSFSELQAAFQEEARKTLTYFVFDMLHLDGRNLRHLPLAERKALLVPLLLKSESFVRLSEHLEIDGDTMFAKACELHAEGIISKRSASKYTSGRSEDWRKSKCIHEQEFVVGGFTLPSNESFGIGALLLGYYKGKQLMYAGRTGTGFTQKTHALLRSQLDGLRNNSNPFGKIPRAAASGAMWVTPKIVVQVHFATWTSENLVRHAAYKGIREDKDASEVRREDFAYRKPSELSKIQSKKDGLASKSSQAAPVKSAPVRLTHPAKLLDLPSALTKQQLADYFWTIAPQMLPYIVDRPLSLVRCPEGSEKPCFYQKHRNKMLPSNIDSIEIPDKKTGKLEQYITISTAEALASLAQLGVMEIHPWGSCNLDLEHPDRIIIDLDPDPAVAWKTLAESAVEIRVALKEIGLVSFLKSTGGKGLHVVVPIEAEYDWNVIKQFSRAFVTNIEANRPKLYLTKMSKAARVNRIYLDYLRNERGATAVAAFSPRARAGATVSLPLSWNDLKLPALPTFQVASFAQWKQRLKLDPWKSLAKTKQRITKQILQAYKVTT